MEDEVFQLGATRVEETGMKDVRAMMDKKTEVKLIRRAKRGEAKAIETLIRQHQGALYAFLLRMSGRTDIAEDIVQEAFVRVLKSLDRFDPQYRFSTWIFTIARRLYVNWVQKCRPVYDSESIAYREGNHSEPEQLSARDESLQHVRETVAHALSSLTDLQREIILLFHQQEWSISDISDFYQMPEGTVKSHLHRARKRMRRLIQANTTMSQKVEEAWA